MAASLLGWASWNNPDIVHLGVFSQIKNFILDEIPYDVFDHI